MPLVDRKKALQNVSNIVQPRQTRALKRTLEASPGHSQNLKKKNNLQDENNDLTGGLQAQIKKIVISAENKAVKAGKGISLKAKKNVVASKGVKPVVKSNVEDCKWPNFYQPPPFLPKDVPDYDKTQINNIDSEPVYAYEIFQYYRQKEQAMKCTKYMERQTDISDKMRSVLVDWLVEVQQTFELNHETLYHAVKIMDRFLMHSSITRSRFQLLGLTALLIASKLDERLFPAIEDFIYISDDAYNRQDVLSMEMEILKALNFHLNYPLSYSFLRRYARCSSHDMETLTLARYILETSLLEYSLVDELDSKMAAASLLLALKMKGFSWNATLEFYSGYTETDLLDLMKKLNDLISNPPKYDTIRNKYLDKVFFEVAKLKPLDL